MLALVGVTGLDQQQAVQVPWQAPVVIRQCAELWVGQAGFSDLRSQACPRLTVWMELQVAVCPTELLLCCPPS